MAAQQQQDYAAYLHYRAACVGLEQSIAHYLGVGPDAPIMREMRDTVDRQAAAHAAPRAQLGGGAQGIDNSKKKRPSTTSANVKRSSHITGFNDGHGRDLTRRLLASVGLALGANELVKVGQDWVRPARGTVVHMVRAPIEFVDGGGKKTTHASEWVVVFSTGPYEYACYPTDKTEKFVTDRIVKATEGHALRSFLKTAASTTLDSKEDKAADQLRAFTRQATATRRAMAWTGSGVRAGLARTAWSFAYPGVSEEETPFRAMVSGYDRNAFHCISLHVGSTEEPEGFGDWAQLSALLHRLMRARPSSGWLFGSSDRRAARMIDLAHVHVGEALFDEGSALASEDLVARAAGRGAAYSLKPAREEHRLKVRVDLAQWLKLRADALFGAAAAIQTDKKDAPEALDEVNQTREEWFAEDPPASGATAPLRFANAALASDDLHCGQRLFSAADVGDEIVLMDDVSKKSSVRFRKRDGSQLYRIADNDAARGWLEDGSSVTVVEVTDGYVKMRPKLDSKLSSTAKLPNPLDYDMTAFEATTELRQQRGGGATTTTLHLLTEFYGA